MTRQLSGETILYFGPEPWSGLWRNRHQLMSRLAATNNVWYIEPATTLRQLFNRKHKSHRKSRTLLWSNDATGVKIFHSPWWIPVIGRRPFKSISIRLYFFFLNLIAGVRHKKPFIWLSRPDMIDFLPFLDAKMSIYHVVDEYSGYGSPPPEKRKQIVEKEANLLRSVDATIVVTPSLFKLKSRHNENTFLVPNAADFHRYSAVAAEMPRDIRDIEKPVIGYTGLIAARLDLEMLNKAAELRPTWSFVFVGSVVDDQCEQQMRALQQRANVFFLGQKSVSDTPAYVQSFDVCTIPYIDNLRAQHASPLKLYEYAAASKPIVATDFAAAREFSGHVKIVLNADGFVAGCEQAFRLDSNSPEIVANKEFAAKNTWETRVQQISEIMLSGC